MTKRIGKNRNTNDQSSSNEVSLNSSTAVTISGEDLRRVMIDVNNNDNAQGFWLRLYPASQDNTKHGIFITSKNGSRPFWTMPSGDIYTGEISAIADGGAPTAYVTEY